MVIELSKYMFCRAGHLIYETHFELICCRGHHACGRADDVTGTDSNFLWQLPINPNLLYNSVYNGIFYQLESKLSEHTGISTWSRDPLYITSFRSYNLYDQ